MRLILSSAMPGKVVHDSRGQYSVLMTELLDNLGGKTGIEAAFNNTRAAIARSSDGEQVPAVSSSLLEDVNFGATENAACAADSENAYFAKISAARLSTSSRASWLPGSRWRLRPGSSKSCVASS